MQLCYLDLEKTLVLNSVTDVDFGWLCMRMLWSFSSSSILSIPHSLCQERLFDLTYTSSPGVLLHSMKTTQTQLLKQWYPPTSHYSSLSCVWLATDIIAYIDLDHTEVLLKSMLLERSYNFYYWKRCLTLKLYYFLYSSEVCRTNLSIILELHPIWLLLIWGPIWTNLSLMKTRFQ